MEYPIIKTQNYLLIVDESEIKKCTYCYDEINKRLFFYEGPLRYNYKRVVAHLPLNNSPILEGVDLLPEINEEEDLSEIIDTLSVNDNYKQAIYEGIQIGYKKAKEKYRFTEDDIRVAINRTYNYVDGDGWSLDYIKNDIIQSQYHFQCDQC